MKRSSRRYGKWLLLGLILLLPITMMWVVASHPLPTGRSLEHSRRLPATKGVPYYHGGVQGYVWLDARTVRQVDSVSNATLDIKDTDVETGTVRKIASYPKGKEGGFISQQLFHLSPDRKWQLFTGFTTSTVMSLSAKPALVQTPLNKPGVLNKPTTILQVAAWMPDSLHWLELSEDKSGNSLLLVHTLDGKIVQRIVVPGVAQWRTLLGVTEHGAALVGENIAKQGQGPRMKYLEVNIKTGQTTENTALNQVSSLQNPEIYTPVLSPKGDRLAWATRHNPGLLIGILRMLRHKPQTARYEISSCRLDGSQLHGVDNVECQGREEVEMMDWLPDNQQISFTFRDTLYTAPVD